MRFHRLLAAAVLSVVLPSAISQQVCSNQQTPQQIDEHIDSLIAKMTIAERVAQLGDQAPAIPRLGLPGYNWWNEGLHGLARDGYATVFPQAIGLAATWDTQLMQSVGDTVSTEARAKFNGHGRRNTPRYGGLTIWSPNINIFRDPRWGRGQETYGEDPFLTASLGLQFVKGVQGDDAFYLKADATPKHFVAHSGPEKGRDSFNAVVSPHDLVDTYQYAFRALTTEGHAAALMCSYNAINGTPSCANPMLEETVRGRWGFAGYVVSDCDAVGNLHSFQHYTADAMHSAAAGLNAGVDLDCGHTYDKLAQAYDQRLVTEAAINRALHRLFVARVRLGMMDEARCTPWGNMTAEVIDAPKSRALALKAAEESMVLLHNDGTLPLKPTAKIAVIGPTADMLKVLEANYHGTAKHPVTLVEGMREAFPQLRYAQGSTLGAGISVVVPGYALRVGREAKATQGLEAEYFNQLSFDGRPIARQVVSRVNIDINRAAPSAAITAQQYAVRWSGYIVPPAAGEYTLRVNVERCWDCKVHDSFKLFVNGKQVVANDGGKDSPDHAVVRFTDTKPQAVRVELLHSSGDEGVALEWLPPTGALLDEAVKTAEKADVIVATVGITPDLEGEALQLEVPGFDGGDRTSLGVPEAQMQLLARLSSMHKPLVIVLTSGSAVALDPGPLRAAALLEAWYPGEEGGHALANLLRGTANPSGRLPVTIYRAASDLPAFDDYAMRGRTYRYFTKPVLFPFGYGLSYSRFEYGRPQLSRSQIAAGEEVTATVTVRNTGVHAGSEVAELYVRPPQGPDTPQIALRGFERLTLQPGEQRTLRFSLSPQQLSFVDAAGVRAVRAGGYRVFVGGSQPAADGTAAELSITGEQALKP